MIWEDVKKPTRPQLDIKEQRWVGLGVRADQL